jgi:hypothetical protein
VQVQPLPRQQFDDLLKRADAAWSDDEGVGLVVHQRLALVHRGDDDGLDVIEQPLAAAQEGRHDADNAAACIVRRPRPRRPSGPRRRRHRPDASRPGPSPRRNRVAAWR